MLNRTAALWRWYQSTFRDLWYAYLSQGDLLLPVPPPLKNTEVKRVRCCEHRSLFRPACVYETREREGWRSGSLLRYGQVDINNPRLYTLLSVSDFLRRSETGGSVSVIGQPLSGICYCERSQEFTATWGRFQELDPLSLSKHSHMRRTHTRAHASHMPIQCRYPTPPSFPSHIHKNLLRRPIGSGRVGRIASGWRRPTGAQLLINSVVIGDVKHIVFHFF